MMGSRHARDAAHPAAVLAGDVGRCHRWFLTAYPVNVWMVARQLKHGLMTTRPGQESAHHGHGMEDGHDQPGHEQPDHEHKDHKQHSAPCLPVVTRPQLASVAVVTTLALIATPVWAASKVNLTLSAHDVGGVVMPPGMVMTRDTPAEAMRDMAAVNPADAAMHAAPDAKGANVLAPRMEGRVKVYDLTASVITWHVLGGQQMHAYALNGQLPGPTLRLTEGDRVRINLTNRQPESTTLHWHGLILPNAMDGPAEIVQPPIQPGKTFSYEYTVGQAGTFFYQSHDHPDRQQGLGLYGARSSSTRPPHPRSGSGTANTSSSFRSGWSAKA